MVSSKVTQTLSGCWTPWGQGQNYETPGVFIGAAQHWVFSGISKIVSWSVNYWLGAWEAAGMTRSFQGIVIWNKNSIVLRDIKAQKKYSTFFFLLQKLAALNHKALDQKSHDANQWVTWLSTLGGLDWLCPVTDIGGTCSRGFEHPTLAHPLLVFLIVVFLFWGSKRQNVWDASPGSRRSLKQTHQDLGAQPLSGKVSPDQMRSRDSALSPDFPESSPISVSPSGFNFPHPMSHRT